MPPIPLDLSTYFPLTASGLQDLAGSGSSGDTITLAIKSQALIELRRTLHPSSRSPNPSFTTSSKATGDISTDVYELNVPLAWTIEETRKAIFQAERDWIKRVSRDAATSHGVTDGSLSVNGHARGHGDTGGGGARTVLGTDGTVSSHDHRTPAALNIVWRTPIARNANTSLAHTSLSSHDGSTYHLLTSPPLLHLTWTDILRPGSGEGWTGGAGGAFGSKGRERMIVTYARRGGSGTGPQTGGIVRGRARNTESTIATASNAAGPSNLSLSDPSWSALAPTSSPSTSTGHRYPLRSRTSSTAPPTTSNPDVGPTSIPTQSTTASDRSVPSQATPLPIPTRTIPAASSSASTSTGPRRSTQPVIPTPTSTSGVQPIGPGHIMIINPAHSTLVQLVHYHQHLLPYILSKLVQSLHTETTTGESSSPVFQARTDPLETLHEGWRASGASVPWEEAGSVVREEMERLGITGEVVNAALSDSRGEGASGCGWKGEAREGSEWDFVASLETGGVAQELVIPDVSQLAPEQEELLSEYRQHRDILNYIQDLLADVPFQIPYTPPTGGNAGGQAEAPGSNFLGGRIRIRTGVGGEANQAQADADLALLFTPQVLLPCLAALLKVQFTLYMFSHGMFTYSIKDKVFWLMMGVSFGWWAWDCHKLWSEAVGRRRREAEAEATLRRVRAEREAREAGVANGTAATDAGETRGQEGPPPSNEQTTPAVHAMTPTVQAPNPHVQPAVPPALPGRRRAIPRSVNDGLLRIAEWGLEHDRKLLRLFHYPDSARPHMQPGVPPDLTVPDHLVPGLEVDLPIAPPQPGVWWTFGVLPIYLLVTSLVPLWDLRRRGLIRERERHMRTVVEKLTAGRRAERAKEILERAKTTGGADAGAETAAAVTADLPTATGNANGEAAIEHDLPGGLSPWALGYYQRVMARGEQIDWDEEREAQAALMGNAGQADAGERLDVF